MSSLGIAAGWIAGALHAVATLFLAAQGGILLQVLATGLPLADDVSRYAVEGMQMLAGQNPYATLPAAAAAVAGEALIAHVSHAETTSIYPPLMLRLQAGVTSMRPGLMGFGALALFCIGLLTVLVLGLLLATRRSPQKDK